MKSLEGVNDVGRRVWEPLRGVLTDGVLMDGVRGVDLPSNLPDEGVNDCWKGWRGSGGGNEGEGSEGGREREKCGCDKKEGEKKVVKTGRVTKKQKEKKQGEGEEVYKEVEEEEGNRQTEKERNRTLSHHCDSLMNLNRLRNVYFLPLYTSTPIHTPTPFFLFLPPLSPPIDNSRENVNAS